MKAVTAGIDGSQAALTAALWGVDESISRAVPLRLISVIKPTHPSPHDYARDSRTCRVAEPGTRRDSHRPKGRVTLETEIPRTPAGLALIEASRGAEMVCAGSVGIGRLVRSPMFILGGRPEVLTDHAEDGAFERRVQEWRQRHPEVRVSRLLRSYLTRRAGYPKSTFCPLPTDEPPWASSRRRSDTAPPGRRLR